MTRTKHTIRCFQFLAFLSAVAFVLVVIPHAAYAQNFTPTQVGSNTDALGVGGIGASTGLVDTDPRIIAAKIIRIALGLLGVVVIGFMIYAGYLWMTAGGDEEKIATAKKVLRNAVIGLAITLSSVAITQFIISKLTAAITGAAQKSGAGSGCVGEQCLLPEFSVFFSTTAPQSPPQLPIKNVVVSVDFFNGLGSPAIVDQNTVTSDAITIVKQGIVDAKGFVTVLPDGAPSEPFKGELKFVDQNTVEFHPIGSCVDTENPANSNTNTDCFEKNTVYKVTLKNSIASKSGKVLDCGPAHPCVSQFVTGEKYDAEPPKISLAQPGNNALVGNGIATLVSAEVSDDAGVKKVAFYENETFNIADKILNPFIASGLVSDQTWKPKLKDPNKSEVIKLTAEAFDIDDHQTLSTPQTVKILPAWCFNNKLDDTPPYNEEKASVVVGAPDCGQKSECGACQGEGCDTDLECATGICIPQPGVKVSFTDQNTKYKAEVSGLPPLDKIIPYYEWHIDGEPLAVAYLPFDKTSDTEKFTSNLSMPSSALNASQVAHAIVAGPKWSATGGAIGGAYQFNNPGDYIESPVLPWNGNQLSIQWWMKRSNPTTPKSFMIAQIKNSLSIQTTGKNTITVSANASDAPNAPIQESGAWPLPPSDGAWHQVTVVFDGSAIRYYIDGAQDPSNIPFAHAVNATDNPLVIGYKNNKGAIAFDGWIDEVRIFTRILNAQQLQADFKSVTETQSPVNTLDVNIAPAKAVVTADAWQLSKSSYEITNTKALYREKKGICVNVPKITNVIEKSGTAGNYVTVIGQSFGTYKKGASSVWFSKISGAQPAKTDQWINADLCSVKAWHDNYVVIKVPQGAVTGQIKIEAQSSLLPGFDGLVFRDTTADSFGPLFDPSEVFKITNEKFPGLCTVDPEKVTAGDSVTLTGTALGDGNLLGDSVLVGIEEESLNEYKEWSNSFIANIKTPVSLLSGSTNIKVSAGGKKSNALPLGILSGEQDISPHIFSIDPLQGPAGTYITLTGKNFGTNGAVEFSQGGDSFVADLPPEYCGTTWTQNQIVVKVPKSIQNKGDYAISVAVKKGVETAKSNKKIFTVNSDPLKPGLCKLEPDNGPLFSAQFSGILFKGEGFGDALGSIIFNKNAEISDPKFFSWDNILIDAHKFSEMDKTSQAKFKTGPVSVANAQKSASNSLQFKIQNCKEELQKNKELAVVCGEGSSCCASGVCEQKGQCPEDKKPGSSVYMWSFTTGKLPVVPKVVEQCGKFCSESGKPCKTTEAEDAVKAKNECNTNIPGDVCALVTPSPSPSLVWEGASNICINASVKVRFDTAIDIDPQKAPQRILLYQCNDKKNCALKDEKQITAVSYALGTWGAAGKTGTMITLYPVSDLLPETQYGVLVTTQVKSNAGALSESMIENPTCPAIAASVTINGVKNLKAAYCTAFVTRATKDYCELGAVVVDPISFTAQALNNKSIDLYSATPIAKGNLCVALNGDDYNWAWSPTNNPSNAFQKTSLYVDISNKAGKLNMTAPVQDLTTKDKETPFGNPEKIIATWIDPILNPTGTIKGIGQLTIKLSNPKVVSYWPQCTTACVNAEVGAEFNVALAPQTVNNHTISLYKCEQFDVNCKQYGLVDDWFENIKYKVELNTDNIDKEKAGHTVIISHAPPFEANTYYKVKAQGGETGVKSIWQIQLDAGVLNDDCDNQGKNCQSYSWIFRTKNNGAACAVDKVMLDPEIAVVKVVGAQATYNALAIGSPDACNPNGQILDTSNASYAWNWGPPQAPIWVVNTDDRAVVWMSNFASGKQEVPWCTTSCLLAGSASAPKAGLCGNGKVESGEECDPLGNNGNTSGVNNTESCGWNCLLYVSVAKGTPPCNASTIAQGQCCGNGPQVLPEAGEECDLGLLNGVAGSGCNNACIKEGTSVSYATCVEKDQQKGMNISVGECEKGKTQYIHNGKMIPVGVRSVCGNQIQEPGEECDKGAGNGAKDSSCSNSCLLSVVDVKKCGDAVVQKDNGESCDPADTIGGKGCSALCQKLGSSPAYGSWCGDGEQGVGESCDESLKGNAQHIDSTQYGTAVGAGVIKDKKQTAMVSATVSQVGQPDKKGIGQFILQCGFAPVNSACPNANDQKNQVFGSGTDSCCYQRPEVSIVKPSPSASNVCPNAVFEIIMKNGKVDEDTLSNNIILAEQIIDDGKPNCPNKSVPFAYETKEMPPQNWRQRIIAAVKHALGLPAYAEQYKYCGGNAVISASSTYDQNSNTSVITVTPQIPLKQKTNYKLLVLNYDASKGWSGLKNTNGLTFVDKQQTASTLSNEFTTMDVPYCKVTDVKVLPDYHLFNKKDATKEFVVATYFVPAGVAEENIQQIAPIFGQYEWSYVWNTSDASIVEISKGGPVESEIGKAVGKNGEAIITGGIKIIKDTSLPSTTGQEMTGIAETQVFLCENPWPGETIYKDLQTQKIYGLGLIDANTSPAGVAGKGKAWNNFQTLYCKDAGKQGFEDDLPTLKAPAVLYHQDGGNPGDPILKEFFFTFEDASKNTDSIGLRVYPNIDHKPLSTWYQSQQWIPKGNPTPTKVGAYEALQEGRTLYVAGLNIDTSAGEDFYVFYDGDKKDFQGADKVGTGFKFVPLNNYGKNNNEFIYNAESKKVTYKNIEFTYYGNFSNIFHIVISPKMVGYTNVYVWSFSDNASAETVNVFNQLLANFTLNINIDNPRVCSADPSISCSKDLDCAKAGGVCDAPLDKAARDLKRIKDLVMLANKIELNKIINQTYPNLKNNPSLGTYIPGYTNSKWLSWQGILGNALQIALPSDPINQFNGCGGGGTVGKNNTLLKDFDAQTCWNATNSTFVCPKGSYVYQYEFTSSTKAQVFADFEIPALKWNKSLQDSVENYSVLKIGDVCTDQVIGLSEKCGDGVVGPGEQCEIGQTQEFSCLDGNLSPVDWIWNGLHYTKYRIVKCSSICTWGEEVKQKPKRCKTNGNTCVKDTDCNPAIKGECENFGNISYACLPKGYCGDGVVQQDAQEGPKEMCDDGANNGKYGHCSIDCKTQDGGGYCGDGKLKLNNKNEPADPNKVCDASALWMGGDLKGWGYITDAQKNEKYADGKLKYSQYGWKTKDNLEWCAEKDNPDNCLWQGAKYNFDKLQSCSWDCQSFDYCGDGKVNNILKSNGKPYEECEKSESCQVGYCTYKNGKKFMKNNSEVLCEKDDGCAADVLNISSSYCDNNKCNIYSSNAGESCKENKDCVQEFTCQNFEAGKRYCQMILEHKPKPNGAGTAFSDDAEKFASNTCVWQSQIVNNVTVTCLPLSSLPTPVSAGVCGDGIIQDGKKGADGKLLPGHGEAQFGAVVEVCDKGTQNGVIPSADYGKTANYCAFGCGQVITVSGGFCGDKNVEGPEYCDMSAAKAGYVCQDNPTKSFTTITCNPNDSTPCANNQTCVTSGYVCQDNPTKSFTTITCNPNDSTPCANNQTCVPDPRWSEDAVKACSGSQVPTGSFLTNCTNTCVGSCKVPVCGDKVLDPGEACDEGKPQTAKDGKNGVVPVLAYNASQKTQDYCDSSCKKKTVSNEYCGDGKLTVPNEQCDKVGSVNEFSSAAQNACAIPSYPKCDLLTCVSICVQPPPSNDVDLKGVSGTSLVVQVVDEDGKYSPNSLDDSKKLTVKWNDGKVYTLDKSNNFQIKFIQLTAFLPSNSNGKLTLTKVDQGNSNNVYVALYAIPVNPTQNSVITDPQFSPWSWTGTTADKQGIGFSITDSIEISITITK